MVGHSMVIEKNSGVSEDHDLMDAVEEYFELSLRTRNLCASIREFVKTSRDAHQIILDRAIAMKEAKIYLSGQDCKEILEELKVFKGGLICVEEFESVYKRLADMQSQLGIGKGKVDRRNKSYKKLMKSRSIAAALVKRLKMLVVKKVLRNVCERNIRLKSKFVLVETMKFGTFKSYRDVETMRVLMDRTCFGEMRGDSSALLLSLKDLINTQPEFLKQLEDFDRQTHVCSWSISKARASVIDKLTVIQELYLHFEICCLTELHKSIYICPLVHIKFKFSYQQQPRVPTFSLLIKA